jgi:hypothetical protein
MIIWLMKNFSSIIQRLLKHIAKHILGADGDVKQLKYANVHNHGNVNVFIKNRKYIP